VRAPSRREREREKREKWREASHREKREREARGACEKKMLAGGAQEAERTSFGTKRERERGKFFDLKGAE
jgi:hypothetical protein